MKINAKEIRRIEVEVSFLDLIKGLAEAFEIPCPLEVSGVLTSFITVEDGVIYRYADYGPEQKKVVTNDPNKVKAYEYLVALCKIHG